MPKYSVHATIGVETCEIVDAETPEQAAEFAGGGEFSLCCHCSEQGDMGDVLYVTVLDESGDKKLFEKDLHCHPPCPVCSEAEKDPVGYGTKVHKQIERWIETDEMPEDLLARAWIKSSHDRALLRRKR